MQRGEDNSLLFFTMKWIQLEIEFTWSYLQEWEVYRVDCALGVDSRHEFVTVNLVTNRICCVGGWWHCFEWVKAVKEIWAKEGCIPLRDLRYHFQIIRNPRAK